MSGYPSDAWRDLGGDRDGSGAEDEKRVPPRVPTHLQRCHEQGGRENTQKFTFPTRNSTIRNKNNIRNTEYDIVLVFNINLLFSI